MKPKSLKVNYFYNMIFTCLNLIFPLITAPYVSRILGAENLGKVNFASAFVNWFILISAFGTSAYGLREVARLKNDRTKLNKLFSELLIIKIFITLIILIVYAFIILNVNKFSLELNLYIILSISIILNIFNIDWFYQGIENYKYITIRSGGLKLVSLIAMFMMIKTEESYVIYGAITIFASSFGNILNYLYSKNFVSFTIKNIDIKRHLSKLIIFFMSALIVSCYTMLDQILVGFLIGDSGVAFLNRCKQVIIITTSLTLALNTVIIPRATFYYENNITEYDKLISGSINYIYILTLPCMIGIMFLSKEIMMLLGGKEFLQASQLLSIMSVYILLNALSNWNYNQILLPTGNEKKGVKTQVIMALGSVISNFTLLPVIGYIGAGITSISVELLGVIINMIYTKKIRNYKIITSNLIKYIIAVFIMTLGIIFIKIKLIYYLNILFVSLIISPIIYFLVLILLKEENVIYMLNLIKNKIVIIVKNK